MKKIDKAQLERLSQFRYQLRRFMRFSEDAAQEAGLTVLQYQLMLHTQGMEGRHWASISELAERLQAKHHGVVALVSRCEAAGLVVRRQNADDGRVVEIHLTAQGQKSLQQIALRHESELTALADIIEQASARYRGGFEK
ncbi:MarR family winged helix-turn-helix transcriptional regulator [Acidovorax sp. LjRoot194]|jgi:DNA-binding MarR family transcriptional regulator|uniref:MarR family winged helix-turn-helix transcriptional regulator n=1 Tax=Acidovorax sp. LjRoot194 TaxID=3342280 RepID=UPI003ECD2612